LPRQANAEFWCIWCRRSRRRGSGGEKFSRSAASAASTAPQSTPRRQPMTLVGSDRCLHRRRSALGRSPRPSPPPSARGARHYHQRGRHRLRSRRHQQPDAVAVLNSLSTASIAQPFGCISSMVAERILHMLPVVASGRSSTTRSRTLDLGGSASRSSTTKAGWASAPA
jgi:hypothetical protein